MHAILRPNFWKVEFVVKIWRLQIMISGLGFLPKVKKSLSNSTLHGSQKWDNNISSKYNRRRRISYQHMLSKMDLTSTWQCEYLSKNWFEWAVAFSTADLSSPGPSTCKGLLVHKQHRLPFETDTYLSSSPKEHKICKLMWPIQYIWNSFESIQGIVRDYKKSS